LLRSWMFRLPEFERKYRSAALLWVATDFFADLKNFWRGLGAVGTALTLLGLATAHFIGVLSKLPPEMLAFVDSATISYLSFSLALHLAISILLFQLTPVLISTAINVTSLLLAKTAHQRSRIPRNPKRGKHREIRYQQFFLKNLRQKSYLSWRVSIAILAFFTLFLGDEIYWLLSSALLALFVLIMFYWGIMATKEREARRPHSARVVSMLLIVVAFLTGSARFERIASNECLLSSSLDGNKASYLLEASDGDFLMVFEDEHQRIVFLKETPQEFRTARSVEFAHNSIFNAWSWGQECRI